jgi:hypothetical protein
MDSRISSLTYDQEIRRLKTLGHKIMRVDFASSAGSIKPSEDALGGQGSGSSASAGLDKAFVISAANILQALVCLSNLIRAAADDSGKVREYANLAEEKVQALGELMRPMLWNPT